MKPSPRPWTMRCNYFDADDNVVERSDEAHYSATLIDANGWQIAMISFPIEDETYGHSQIQQEANAELILAACNAYDVRT